MKIDLHVPTNATPGFDRSPAQAVDEAKAASVAVLAVADRHSAEALADCATACERAGIRFVPAVKFAAHHGGYNFDLIAYFIRIDDPECERLMARALEERILPAFEAMDRLRELSGTPVLVGPERLPANVLVDLIANGLEGFEAIAPHIAPGDIERLRRLASEQGVLVTAGSGAVPNAPLGVDVPDGEVFVEALLARRLPLPSRGEE